VLKDSPQRTGAFRLADWLGRVREWAQHADIRAVALVGSYATGKAQTDSDVDTVLVVDSVESYLADTRWLSAFGVVRTIERGDYGLVQSLHVVYEGLPEIEWGLTDLRWVSPPFDEGTLDVIRAGFRSVHDPAGLLLALARHAAIGA
jgi:hypothetical protein